MFEILSDKTICITRGDIAGIRVSAKLPNGQRFKFTAGDIVRFSVVARKNYGKVVLQKDVVVEEDAENVDISLSKEDTTIGELISKPVDYWYEIEVNPDIAPQTIIGHNADGPKIFRLYPEGGERE